MVDLLKKQVNLVSVLFLSGQKFSNDSLETVMTSDYTNFFTNYNLWIRKKKKKVILNGMNQNVS